LVSARSRVGIAGVLERELGAGRVLGPEAGERLDDFGGDECADRRLRRRPDCVVLAERREEVEAVMRLCRERRVPVTARGAGSGKTGACAPIQGGVVLSTERMTHIREIDRDDLVAVVEPGVITGQLHDAVEEVGLFYPPDPASLAFCSIGGNVATNAGGPRAFQYGATRHYVLGLEVVLMGGEVLRVGGRTVKRSTGYDFTGSFVGSEGTLAFVSEIVLRLVPRPPAVRTALAVFGGLDRASEAIDALLRHGVRPRTLELIDRTCIEHTAGRTAYQFPAGAQAAVLLELDGEEDRLDAALERAGMMCEDAGAREVLVARDERDRRNLWQARRDLTQLLGAGNRWKVSEDICVPRGKLGEMLRRFDRISADTGIRTAAFGHAGDGNIHAQLLFDRDPDDPEVGRSLEVALRRLFEDTIDLGGTLSGEHGVGLSKARFLPLEMPPALIEWQRRLKHLWDPEGLLNPGKVLPVAPSGCTE
jgi:glycolate oxidase